MKILKIRKYLITNRNLCGIWAQRLKFLVQNVSKKLNISRSNNKYWSQN